MNNMSLFPPEQLKIPTPSGKYMHSLVNKENTLAAPLNNRFLFLQNTSKLPPPLANTCAFLLTKKTNFPPPWKKHVSLSTRTIQNCHPLWQIHGSSCELAKHNCHPSEKHVPFSTRTIQNCQPPLANTCIVSSTNRTNLRTPLNNTFLCPPEQFNIATPYGKYMHTLAN